MKKYILPLFVVTFSFCNNSFIEKLSAIFSPEICSQCNLDEETFTNILKNTFDKLDQKEKEAINLLTQNNTIEKFFDIAGPEIKNLLIEKKIISNDEKLELKIQASFGTADKKE